MSYNKPEVVLLGSAVKAIQSPVPKNINTYQEGVQLNGFTPGAYAADE